MRSCWVVLLFVVVRLGYFSGCSGFVVGMQPGDDGRYEFLVDMRCLEQKTEAVHRMGWWFPVRYLEEVFPGNPCRGQGEVQVLGGCNHPSTSP